MGGYITLAAAVAEIINKRIPNRKEKAILDLRLLEELLGKALLANEDMLASQIRKRMKQIRRVYREI